MVTDGLQKVSRGEFLRTNPDGMEASEELVIVSGGGKGLST